MKRVLALALVVGLMIGGGYATTGLGKNFKVTAGAVNRQISATVKARDLQLVCPGGTYRTGGAAGTKVGVFDQLATASVSTTWSGQLQTQLKIQELTEGTGSRVNLPFSTTAPTSITALDPTGAAVQGSSLLSANQIQLVKSESINGLAAASCQRPSTDLWLLGGSVATGREALLVITNASPVDATVNLELFTNLGQIKTAALSGVSVSAGTTKVLPLASYVSQAESVAVHVQSQGGAVASWLQVKTVRGLSASGLDWVSPSEDFADQLVIPGVFIRGSKDAQNLIAANPDFADLKPVLRLFAPLGSGSDAASPVAFNAQLIGSNDQTFGTVIQDRLTPGRAVDFSLDGLADGDYSAFIIADRPILASVRLVRTTGKSQTSNDFAWLPAAGALQSARVFITPASGVNKLSVANSNSSDVAVKLVNLQTLAATELTVPTNGSVSLDLINQAAMSIEAASPVQATMILDLNGSVANLPITDYRNLGGRVSVSIR